MPNNKRIIDERLLDDMVFEILADDVTVPRPGIAVGTKSPREAEAEEEDEALFRKALLSKPVSEAKEIVESMRAEFSSAQFGKCCLQALQALVDRSKTESSPDS